MPHSFRIDAIWSKLQDLELQGNINALITEAVEQFPTLKPLAGEVLNRIAWYIRKVGIFISPATIDQLKSLPEKSLKTSGLAGEITGRRFSCPESEVGGICFPVVATSGMVRRLSVMEMDARALTPERTAQLDRVGSPVIAVLEKRLNCRVFWNPSRYTFTVLDHLGNEDPKVEGRSMDLPLALALYSLMTNTPLPPEISATAQVKRDGSLNAIENLPEKFAAIRQERYYIRDVIISQNQSLEKAPPWLSPVRAETLAEAIDSVFPDPPSPNCLRTELDIIDETKRIIDQYSDFLYDTCMENTDRLISYLTGAGRRLGASPRLKALFFCYWRKGCCLCHKGDVNKSMALLKKAQRFHRRHTGRIEEKYYHECRNNYAVALKDVFRYETAEVIHKNVEIDLERIGTLDHVRAKNLSSLSQLYLACHRYEEAATLQSRALKMIDEKDRWRNYGILAQIYSRWGRFDRARYHLKREKELMDRYNIEFQGFFDYMRAEYWYRKVMAGQRQSPRGFITLHRLVAEHYDAIHHYVAGLIHKFDGLSLLAEGQESAGLERLEGVVRYFESYGQPMFRLLAVTVRTERALFFLATGRPEIAADDVSAISEALAFKAFRHHFKDILPSLKRFERIRKRTDRIMADTLACLQKIRNKIPY